MKELKLNDYEVEELDSSEMEDIDGGWYVKLLWGAIEFGNGPKPCC